MISQESQHRSARHDSHVCGDAGVNTPIMLLVVYKDSTYNYG